jgi:formiminoglutamate deiminase
MASLHSHAFQRGMAGLAEIRGEHPDSFWTWRETMYRFALAFTPEQMEAIATWLYIEMLEAGFTRVGEFHYLHNDRDGRPYANPAEMATRIGAAAQETGIGLTLLPCLYAHSQFGGAEPLPGQRRFISDLDGFARILDGCRRLAAALPGTNVGVAPHSLRAVTPTELAGVVDLQPGGPIHIHAAEQVKEVEDCLTWSGKRPVQWLLDNAGLDGRWCLIHATHMLPDETTALARSGATAGLCPLTEASLGDGIFDGACFLGAGGNMGIGTDSNILLNVASELRQLETTQRLRDRARNVLAGGPGSTGRRLYEATMAGGHRALGVEARAIAVGAPADLVSIDLEHPSFAAIPLDQLLDAWIFASPGAIDRVIVGGKVLVTGGRHVKREPALARYRAVMRALAEV